MKPFTTVAIIAFAIISLLHIARVLMGWEAEVNHVAIPLWTSILAALGSGLVSFMLWKENK